MDAEILEIFFSEAEELVGAMESGLLALEKNPGDTERLHSVFRAAHTMKGNAATIGLDHLIKFAHTQENILDMLRQGKLILTPDVTSVLLSSVDVLRTMVRDSLEGRETDTRLTEEYAKRLKAIETGSPAAPVDKPAAKTGSPRTAPTEPAPVRDEVVLADDEVLLLAPTADGQPPFGFPVVRKALEEVLFADLKVYGIRVSVAEDLIGQDRSAADFEEQLRSFGQSLADDLDKDGVPAYHAFMSSILEDPGIVALALGLPGERIHAFDPAEIKDLLTRESAPEQLPVVEVKIATPAPVKKQTVAVPEPPIAPISPPRAAPAAVAIPSRPRPRTGAEPPVPAPAPTAGRKVTGSETIRVNVELIDTLMNLAGELVLGRNQLRRMLEGAADRIAGLGSVLQNVDVVTSDIQEHIMKMRMQPVSNVLNKFPRVVRDLSLQLSKEVEFSVRGAEVELDKSILEALSDPLTHLIRNAVDHAIEPPEERAALDKPRSGRVSIRAFHEEGQVHMTVADDGRGISPDRVVEKALSLGLVDPARARMMSESEKLGLIFVPGFSMAAQVTDVSGRGVGMDVVKTNIEKIGGHLEIDSAMGIGTTFRLRLPLTLAIIPSLVVGTARQHFAIPQTDVAELVCVEARDAVRRIERVGAADVLRLRERLLPLVRLADVLGYKRTFIHPDTAEVLPDRRDSLLDRRETGFNRENQKNQGRFDREHQRGQDRDERRRTRADRRRLPPGDIYVVVLRVGQNRFGLVVDELSNTEEIVVKPLQAHVRDCKAFSGTTIMGDGKVAMILSANGIADTAGLIFGEVGAEEKRRLEGENRRREENPKAKVSIVVFNNAPGEFFALPLSAISRLERISPDEVTRIGHREYARFRNQGLPLIRLEEHLPVSPVPADCEEMYVIIPRTDGPPAGILAARIVDTLETDAVLTRERARKPGLAGSAIVEGNFTMFLDAEELMEMSAVKK